MSVQVPMKFDITGKIPDIAGSLEIAAWLFLPSGHPRGVMFCSPGGSYTKAYYHLSVAGIPEKSYSFAMFMAQQGWIVVSIDHLGTGESTHLEQDERLSAQLLAQANDVVCQQLNSRLVAGTLHPALPTMARSPLLIGVGHSMGGMLTLSQHYFHRRFNAVAILGWSNIRTGFAGAEAKLARALGIDAVDSIEIIKKADSKMMSPAKMRDVLADLFFAPDVPKEVIEADTALATSVPAGVSSDLAKAPQVMPPIASRMDVPVFLSLAEKDVYPDLEQEATTYPEGLVFSYLLPGSYHCHNFATTRMLQWTMLEGWAKGIARQYQS